MLRFFVDDQDHGSDAFFVHGSGMEKLGSEINIPWSATLKYPPIAYIFHVQNSARCDGAVYARPGRLGVPAAVARHPAGVRAHPGGGGGGAAAHLALLLVCRVVRAAGTLAPRRLHLIRLQAEHRHLPSGGWSASGSRRAKMTHKSSVPDPMTFWCGSGSGFSDPCLWLMDPDPVGPKTVDLDLKHCTKVEKN